jgi:hypothetical protein
MSRKPKSKRASESNDETVRNRESSEDASLDQDDEVDAEEDDFDDDTDEFDDEDEGEEVFHADWDGGGMANNGFFYITLKNSKYYFHDVDSDDTGPYSSLDEALRENNVFSDMVNSTTQSIDCSELSAQEIASRIDLEFLDEGQLIIVNNNRYIYDSDQGLVLRDQAASKSRPKGKKPRKKPKRGRGRDRS